MARKAKVKRNGSTYRSATRNDARVRLKYHRSTLRVVTGEPRGSWADITGYGQRVRECLLAPVRHKRTSKYMPHQGKREKSRRSPNL